MSRGRATRALLAGALLVRALLARALLAGALLAGVLLAAATLVAAPAAAALPWLHVNGVHVVDPAGKPVRLVGMGLSPVHSEWKVGGFKDLAAVVAWYQEHGCNSMRVAFSRNHDYLQTTDLIATLGPDEFVAREIDPQVREVVGRGLYAIIDWHPVLDPRGGVKWTGAEHARYLEEMIAVWAAIARRYRDEPGVAIYEVWNEPTWPGLGAGDPRLVPLLHRWYWAVIEAIRKVDQRHVIMVSDHNAGWGTAKEPMWVEKGKLHSPDLLAPPQIVYSHHAGVLNEDLGENEAAEAFSRRYKVPVAYGEVELQPDLEGNKVLGARQPLLLKRLVQRQLKNGLFQVWQGWRSGIDEWLEIWQPLARTGPPPRRGK
jgi:hypothetical protein